MKNLILTLAIFCSFSSCVVHAQKSVVVVPLLSDDAVPGIAAFASQSGQMQVTDDVVVVDLSMTFPSEGTVIVNASGGTIVGTDEPFALRCSINKNSSRVDFTAEWQMAVQIGETPFPTNRGFGLPFSGTRGFDVNSGTDTFMLVCDLGSGENVQVRSSQLTAMYFPH